MAGVSPASAPNRLPAFRLVVGFAIAVCAVASAFLLLLLTERAPDGRGREVPLPFLPSGSANLVGSVLYVRTLANGIEFFEVDFVDGPSQQTRADKVYLVNVPAGVGPLPFERMVWDSNNGQTRPYYGYIYTSPQAASEIDNRNAPQFASRFPGTFFASAAAMAAHGADLNSFATLNGIVFTIAGANTTDHNGVLLRGPQLIALVPVDRDLVLNIADVCGNGWSTAGEACDDNNSQNGDGCSGDCAVEAGFSCDARSPSHCVSVSACGDGTLGDGETCDDGNADAGDGCGASCAVEAGFTCTGTPSQCVGDELLIPELIANAEDDCGGQACAPKTIRLFPLSVPQLHGTQPWLPKGDARLIDEDITKATQQHDFVYAWVASEYGHSIDVSSTVDLGPMPANIADAAMVSVRLVGLWPESRVGGELHAMLTDASGEPLTEERAFPAFAEVTRSGGLDVTSSLVIVSLNAIPGKSAAQWLAPRLRLRTTCDAKTSQGCLYGNLYILALNAEAEVVCAGACQDTSPRCGNGIVEAYNDELCDDGDADDENACDNRCAETGNWWIESLGTTGPVAHPDAYAVLGPVLALPDGTGVAAWGDRSTHYSLSAYKPGVGWSEPYVIEEGEPEYVDQYGITRRPELYNNTASMVATPQGGVSVFHQTTYGAVLSVHQWVPEAHSWRSTELLRGVSIPFFDQPDAVRIDPDGRGVALFYAHVPLDPNKYIYQDGTTYTVESGVIAVPFSGGAWGQPVTVAGWHEVGGDRQASMAGLSESHFRGKASVTGRTGDAFHLDWFGLARTLTVP